MLSYCDGGALSTVLWVGDIACRFSSPDRVRATGATAYALASTSDDASRNYLEFCPLACPKFNSLVIAHHMFLWNLWNMSKLGADKLCDAL